jgi:hypothetical protein
MSKCLRYTTAIKEAIARHGYGTSRFYDFMRGWEEATKRGRRAKEVLKQHGRSYRHQKRVAD